MNSSNRIGGLTSVPVLETGSRAETMAPRSIWSAAGTLLAAQHQAAKLTRLERNGAHCPLSFAQERLWWLEAAEPGTPYYHVPLLWWIHGALDVPVLKRTLDLLVQRHEALRTSFCDSAAGLSLRVHDWTPSVEVIESTATPDLPAREQALAKAREFARQPFAFSSSPPLRMALYRLGEQEHLLVWVIHQMNFDGGSFRVITREMAEVYRALSGNTTPTLPPLPVRHSDFAQWQRTCLQGELLASALEFWRGQFQQRYEPLNLPIDHPRRPVGITPGAQVPVSLPKSLAGQMKALSLSQGVTPFAALLASFSALLSRYTGQTDVLTLVSTAARTQPELRNLVGLVANVLPLRMDLSGNPGYRQLITRASNTVSSALAHQLLPLSRILELLPPATGEVNTPLLQVYMVYNSTPLATIETGQASFTPSLEIGNGTAKFDLLLDLADSPAGITGHVRYRSDLFERSTVERLVRHWEALLDASCTHPDLPINALPMPTDLPCPVAPVAATRPPAFLATTLSVTPRGEAVTAQTCTPPRNELEHTLLRIWQGVFHHQPIGIHDNFFALGGHSLVAVKLIVAMEKELGRKLRLSTIFQEPTIARLAAAIRENRASSASSIVEIQPRGTRPPLFLVHGVGGGMFWGYSNLARELGPEQPVYGFKSRGLEGLEEFPRIEDMAAQYVADLRQFQPQGPYHLGGYCFGGNVAYEMARQLRAQQQTVALLLLMNCWPNNSSYTRLSWTPAFLAKAIWNFCVRLEHQVRSGARQPREFFKWRTAWVAKRFKAMVTQKVEDRVAVEDIVDLSPQPEPQRRLWHTHVQAWLQYQPQPYAGKIVLFRTRGHPLVCSYDHRMGWGSFAAAGVDVRICPGDHESILEEGNVAHVARELKSVLEQLRSAGAKEAGTTPVMLEPKPAPFASCPSTTQLTCNPATANIDLAVRP